MTTPEPGEPSRDADIPEIQADIERTRDQLGDTVDALSANLDAKKAAVKPSLAVVASVAGASVVAIIWWRRRSGRGRG